MSFMETGDGPSSSFSNRGGRGWGGNSRGSYQARGGRGAGRSYNSYDNYDQESYAPQGGRGGRENRPNNYSNGNSWNSNSRAGGGGYRGRNTNYWGNTTRGSGGRYQSRGRGRGRGYEFDDPADIEFLKILRGHTAGVTAMVVDPSSGQLFTGAKDQTVRLWDVQTAKCLKTVEVGGEVDSMLMESGILFVGVHMAGDKTNIQNLPGSVRIYNLQSGAEHTLQGHLGPVYTLAAANNMLFSGGHDQSIRVWQFNQPVGMFEPAAVLTAAQGGHSVEVKALQVINTFLFSADFQGVIKVWDIQRGQCVQTIQQAHSSVIMSLLAWEGYLLSGSTDGTAKVWQPCENPGPGSVLDPQPAYCHPPNATAAPAGPDGDEMFGKVLALGGTTDGQGKSVLLTSYSQDSVVRLWQLPDFAERGHLNAIRNCIAVICCQAMLFAGDYINGNVKVWRWKSPGLPL